MLVSDGTRKGSWPKSPVLQRNKNNSLVLSVSLVFCCYQQVYDIFNMSCLGVIIQNNSCHFWPLYTSTCFAFSAKTLLVGRGEEHPASKNEWWSASMVFVWSEVQMICIWSSCCHCHPTISWFIKIHDGFAFLVPAYSGCPSKEAVKRASVYTCQPVLTCTTDLELLVIQFWSSSCKECNSKWFVNNNVICLVCFQSGRWMNRIMWYRERCSGQRGHSRSAAIITSVLSQTSSLKTSALQYV